MSGLLIRNADEIATPFSGARRGAALGALIVIPDGSAYIENGTIKAVGPLQGFERDITGDPKVIDARGKTVIPGFVDAHTHLVFAGTREDEFSRRISGATYREIAESGGGIVRTVKDTRSASKTDLLSSARSYLDRALKSGTTTMEVKTGYGLDLDAEMKMLEVVAELDRTQPVDLVPTFLGAHAFPKDVPREEYIEQLFTMLPAAAEKARYCDVFCEEGYFTIEESRAILEKAKEYGMRPRLHADQFASGGGVTLGVEVGARSVDHLEQISDGEIAALAQSDTVAVLLPGVSFFLDYGYPPARKIIDAGCITAIATDFNPGSCMCISMQMIIGLACIRMKMTPEEALAAATVNAAVSLDLENVGSIQPGMQADVLILDVKNHRMIPYFFGENHVDAVIKRGEIVWMR